MPATVREADRLRVVFIASSLAADHLVAAVRREPYHLFSGNRGVRRQAREFAGIAYRPDRGHLGRLERWAVLGVGQLVRGPLAR